MSDPEPSCMNHEDTEKHQVNKASISMIYNGGNATP